MLPPTPEAVFRVARTPEEWGGPPIPGVDFREAMVIVASAGMAPTGGYLMTVQSVTQLNGEVHVAVQHRAPGSGCDVTQASEWVGQVVAAQRVDAPVHFHVTRTQAPPCIDPPVAVVKCWVEGSDLRATSLHVPEGSTVVCDGTESGIDGGQGGPPVRGTWELVSVPEASSLAPGPLAEEPQARLQPDAPGAYSIRLTVYDPQGTTATADASILVGPVQQQLQVQLDWEPVGEAAPSYPANRLMVLRNTRGCYEGSPSLPAWCEAEPLSADNPSAGTVIRLPADRARGEFVIVLDYPNGSRPGEIVAHVTAQADGVLIREWRDTEPREAGDRWEIGTIRMPEGTLQ